MFSKMFYYVSVICMSAPVTEGKMALSPYLALYL